MAAYTTIDDAGLFFNPTLYTGNGTAIGSGGLAVTGVGFQSDFTWIKDRDATQGHVLFDVPRGATNILASNSSAAESNNTESLTTWGADGFTLGDKATVNNSGADFVSWNWKGGTTSGITTDGSTTITTSAYSFNQTSGFSVLAYTGNATAGAGLPHGLGATPTMIITKNLQTTDSWMVYHKYLHATPEDYACQLDTTGAAADNITNWNDTTPDSVNITFGDGGGTNSANTFVAYAFTDVQGYSKFGGYEGNGNVDSPFLYTGFRPAYILIKRTDTTGSWWLFDDKRLGYNPNTYRLYANDTAADNTDQMIDFVSNGFKLRTTDNEMNASGGDFVYAAFAQSPFVNSSGVPTNAR